MVTEFVQLGEKGWLQSESYGILNPTLLILGFVSDPHTHPQLQSPFIILTGNKIYGLSIVSETAAAFHLPFPHFSLQSSHQPFGT